MVRVPVYEGPTVKPTGYRAEQQIRAPEAAFGGAVGQALQQFGQQTGQVASLLDRRAQEQAREDNALKSLEAFTNASEQARRLMWEGDNSIYSRRGGQAMGASKEAAVELKRIGDETLQTLDNDDARRGFLQFWTRHQDSELGSVSRHEAGQRREYRDQAVAGTLKTLGDQAASHWNNPDKVQESIELGELAIRANTQGLPPQAIDAQVRAMRSGVHKGVVLRRAVTDPMGAQQYYNDHADDFTADDNVSLQRTLAPVVKRANARQAATDIIGEVTRTQAAAPETVRSAVKQVESGGRQNAVSSAGNFGVMQINDVSGKEAAEALGIPYDPKRAREDAVYNEQLGGKYLDMMLERFGGNRALALAAYNAGPGMVEDWINGTNKAGKNPNLTKLGDPRTGAISDAAWAAKIPITETRQYIAKVEGKLGAGLKDNVDLTRATEIARERYSNDPEMLDAVEGEVTRESNRREAARRDREQQALTEAWRHVNAGGSVDTLDPEVIAALPYGRRSDLEARERSLQKGREPPENPQEYERLTMLAMTNPEAFAAERASDWEKTLPPAQVRHFVDLKFRLQQADAKELAKAADLKKGLSLAGPLLKAAGVDTSPKEGSTAATQYAAFGNALLERLEAFKAKEQRKPTDAETMDMAKDLLLPGRLSQNWWPDTEKRVFEVETPEDKARFYVPFKKIPDDSKVDITKDLTAAGVPVTNDLVEQVYALVRRKDKAGIQRLIQSARPAAGVGGATASDVLQP